MLGKFNLNSIHTKEGHQCYLSIQCKEKSDDSNDDMTDMDITKYCGLSEAKHH